jgi:hypothetical protein
MIPNTRAIPRVLIATASICLLASAARAGDQGDPAQSCDGNTYEMVECLKAKRIDAGECIRSMTEARARELEGLGHK